MPDSRSDAEKVADVIRDSGGRVVGRTRLQKLAYLFELAGVGDGFPFAYRNYGPYSHEFAMAVQNAALLELVAEEEHPSSWEGFYSVFQSAGISQAQASGVRARLARVVTDADAVELELAATAAYLAAKGEKHPWEETAKRKPLKATEVRLQNARALYERIRRVQTPKPLPKID